MKIVMYINNINNNDFIDRAGAQDRFKFIFLYN